MVTLKPSIPEVVPSTGQLGEFLFLIDCSLFQDAQVPSEEVFSVDFSQSFCSGGGDRGKLLHGSGCSA